MCVCGRLATICCLLLLVVHGCLCDQHIENVALNKKCNMSSNWNSTPRHEADWAVNDNTGGVYGTSNCIHSGAGDKTPSWEVDLGRSYPVFAITVWARDKYIYRMADCEITVDNKHCYSFPSGVNNSWPREFNINCSSTTLNGRVVRVSRSSSDTRDYHINMCEFQVWSCSAGYWGFGCNNTCGQCRDGAKCDKVTGVCDTGCPAGLEPPLCAQECGNGTYGQDCKQNCSTNCDDVCDKVRGNCTCQPGWIPPFCEEECKDGTFGQNCSQNCSSNCADVCDKVNGTCTCKSGWIPPVCEEECKNGTYGQDCRKNCSTNCEDVCDKVNGTCRCKSGWIPPRCEEECGNGTYGQDCSQNCSANCANMCDKIHGNCTCQPGWNPPLCEEECRDGTYGQGCKQSCSTNCDDVCDKVHGNCTCQSGWIPPLCEEKCRDGTYGQDCSLNCSTNCADVCDKKQGTCTCQPEWNPPSCEEGCAPGYWGRDCTKLCGSCAAGSCSREEGVCLAQGCEEGYTGPSCTTPVESNVGAIVGPVVSVIVIIIIVIVVVLVIRRAAKGRRPLYQEAAEDGNPAELSDLPKGGGLSMSVSDQTKKPKVAAVKPFKAGDTSETSGPVYSNMAELTPGDADGTGDHIYGNVPSAATNRTDAQRGTARNGQQKPSVAPRNPAGIGAVYQNVVPQPRPGQSSAPASASQSAAAVTKPDKPKVKPKGSVSLSAVAVDDDDDVYNSEGIYSSAKEMTSQHFDPFQQYLIKCLGSGQLAAQFAKLPKGMKHPHEVGMTDENNRKNRFKALCAYDYNRVVLTKPAGDKSSDYINATYIMGADGNEKKYIATQGPRDNTVDDLWWMVWQEEVTQIVMLTNLMEEGKDKCEEYWPAPGTTKTYGHVTVRGLEEQERADFIIRPFTIKTQQNPFSRHVSQYHYRAWPDHGVPQAASLVDFWRYVKGRSNPDVPLLVHCSAGVGRTGTFIALDIALDLESRGESVDVNSLVTRLREERCLMVQSEGQYKFVHEVILEAHTSRESRLPTTQLEVIFPTTIRTDKGNPRIDKEFQMLREMGQFAPTPRHTMATLPENIDKNRNKDALPDDGHIVYLGAHVRGRNQYINAVYLSSLHHHHGFILTQLPLQDTVVDFWRLVDGNDVRTIVSIGSKEEERSAKDYCHFWPIIVEDDLTAGPYTITLTNSNTTAHHLTTNKLTLQATSDAPAREVEILHYKNWTGEVPRDVTSVLHLVDTVKAIHSEDGSQVIVQCIDGAAKSGLFCALYDVISRMTYDDEVDVYLTARQIQRVRPQAITTQAQYRFLYQAAQEYSRHLDIYQNADVRR